MRIPTQVIVALAVTLCATTATAKKPPTAQFENAICKGRAKCFVRHVFDGGKDEKGAQNYVVEIGLAGKKAKYDEASMGHCAKHRYWLVKAGSDGMIEPSQLLLSLCNDGYGSRMMGEDHVAVSANQLTWQQTGGSAWMWDQSTTLQLSPLRVLAENTGGWWTLGLANHEQASWNWKSFSGRVSWSSPRCRADGTAPSDAKDGGSTYEYAYIPEVGNLPPTFRKGGWKKTSLGSCSLNVDTAHRFVVHGKRGDAKDASMRVVAASPTEYYVEIRDDHRVVDAEKWIWQDHLEVWTGPRLDYMSHCIASHDDADRLSQWGILLDGTVKTGYGQHTASAKAEVYRAKGVGIRMKITLSKPPRAVTFVYSDSDDGKSQERLVATSDLKYGHAATLGRLKPIDAHRGSCRVTKGRLDWRPHQTFKPGVPAIGYP